MKILRSRSGQLFVIEVIVAVSVLLVLVSALFTTQQLSPPPEQSTLVDIGNNVISDLVDSGAMWVYLSSANYSYYKLGSQIFDKDNSTKTQISDTIASSVPLVANFKVFTFRYNSSLVIWERIDIVNFEANSPSGSEVAVVEFYTPGFNGILDQFKFQLTLWYEVQS